MNAPQVPDFGPAEESLQWAKADILNFETALRESFGRCKATIVQEYDEAQKGFLVKLKLTGDEPFSAIKKPVVSALLNCRHSFDQAVNIAASSILKRNFKGNFPWGNSPTDLKGRLEMKAFPKQLWEPIEVQEPYPRGDNYAGGNNLIRKIAQQCNQKHSFGFVIQAHGGFHGVNSLEMSGDLKRVEVYPPNWSSHKQEAVIAFFNGGTIRFNFDKNPQAGFDIFLEVAGLSHPPDVRFAINEFFSAAERNLKLIKAACGK